MKICVYAEPLRTITSANPFRGMLQSLLKLRYSDTFIFVVRRGSEDSPQLRSFLASCDSGNWKLIVDPKTRKAANLQALLRQENYCAIREKADVYLNMDMDYLGPRAMPLIATVADLSSIRYPKHSSLKWSGVQIRKHAFCTMVKYASHVIAISEFTKQDLEEYDPSLKGRVTVAHCGIDDDWHRNKNLEEDELHRDAQYKRPYWIWWGNVTKRKNVDGLLRAYAKLSSKAPDEYQIPDIFLIGTLGSYQNELPNLIEALKISDRIQLMPFQPLDKLIRLVGESSGLLFPSHHEGFGMPIIEAMALGKPVLISNRAALPEVAGGLAVVCNPEDLYDLCDGMSEMLRNEQNSRNVIAARKEWAANFTHAAAAQKYSQVITRVASRTK